MRVLLVEDYAPLRESVAQGARHPGQVKIQVRAGMGLCQGRMCGATIAEIIAASSSLDIAQINPLRGRAPLKPLTIEQLAKLEQLDEI